MDSPIKMCADIKGIKTAIICTLAPAQIKGVDQIKKFTKAGMRIVRLNFSHIEEFTKQDRNRLKNLSKTKRLNKKQKKELNSLQEKKGDRIYAWKLIELVRKTEKSLKREFGRPMPIGIMMDLCGPRLRTGEIKGSNAEIKPGHAYTFSSNTGIKRVDEGCSISSEDFLEGRDFISDLRECFELQKTELEELESKQKKGERLSEAGEEQFNMLNQGLFIYVNDGRLKFKVEYVDDEGVHCRIVRGGKIERGKGVNVPYCKLSLPPITRRDEKDLDWIFSQERRKKRQDKDFRAIDFVAESFVKHKDDITGLKTMLSAKGHEDISIIAKIETPEALRNLEEIMKTTDGVMVARGDLGVEISLAKVPKAQRLIIDTAGITYGDGNRNYDVGPKFVIVATQMLESMITGVQPLRAEVADINTAILEGADGIMTSAETIEAEDPTEVVRRMAEIAREAEQERDNILVSGYRRPPVKEQSLIDRKAAFYVGLAESACILAQNKNSPAIIVSTWSGRGAKIISSFKPRSKIIAITEKKTTVMHLLMYTGICPVLVDTTKVSSTEDYLRLMQTVLQELGISRESDVDVVAFFGIKLDKPPIGGDTLSDTVRLFKIKS